MVWKGRAGSSSVPFRNARIPTLVHKPSEPSVLVVHRYLFAIYGLHQKKFGVPHGSNRSFETMVYHQMGSIQETK